MNLTYRVSLQVLTICLLCSIAIPTHAATLSELTLKVRALQQSLDTYILSIAQHPVPTVKGVSTVVVSTDFQLAHAIASSTGGETIQLAPGTYGTIQMNGGTYNNLSVGTTKISKGTPALNSAVIIISQDSAHPAVVKSIDIRSSGHWHFKGLAIRPIKSELTIQGAVSLDGSDCTFEDSTLTYGEATNWSAADWLALSGDGIWIRGANNIVRNNTINNVYMGIQVFNTAVNSQVLHNTLNGIGGDGMRLLASYVTVDSNLFKNFKQINLNHDDCTQSWGLSGSTLDPEGVVRGVIYQNNICINNDNPNASVSDPLYDNPQGFDAFDGSMQDWVVQNNVYVSTAYWGIQYAGAVNMKIRNNTIIDSDAVQAGENTVTIAVGHNSSGNIQATGNRFENNISNVFKDSRYGSSSVVTNNQAVKMVDYDTYFRNWRQGDVRLLPTSPIQGVGANLDPATVGSNVTVSTLYTQSSYTTYSQSSYYTQGTYSTYTQSTYSGGGGGYSQSTYYTQSTYSGGGSGGGGSTHPSPSVTPTTTPTTQTNRVIANERLNVRSTANGTIIGVQLGGVQGTTSGTPVTNGAYTWIYVNFDTGVDGYVAQSYTHAAGTVVSTNPNQAKITQLLQLLALLQQMLAALKAQGH